MRELLIIGSSALLPPPPPNNHTPPPFSANSKTLKTNTQQKSPAKLSRSSSSSSTSTSTSTSTSSSSSSSSPSLLLKNFHQNASSQQQQSGRGGGALLTYYADLASKLAQDGRLEDFLMIAETVLASISNPSQFVASLNLKLVSAGVSTLISHGRLHYVIQVFTRLDKLGVTPSTLFDNNKSIQNLLASECRLLVKARKLKDVVTLMETLAGFLFPVKGFVKPSEIFNLCIEESDPDTAVRHACMLPQAPIIFSSIILEFGKKGDLASAFIAYESSKRKFDGPNMYLCRTMIDVCGLCGDFLKSRYIYEGLLAQNITPNTYVFNSLMNVNVHDLSYDLHVYKHMKNLGVTPDLASYNILLKACCRAGRVDLAQDIYEEVRHIALLGRLKLDVITYSTIIKVFGDAKMWQMALKIKEDMLSAGVIPSVVTWSSLISACANAGLVKQATQVFEEMLLADCQPNTHCYNSLLFACVEARQYDRAFRIFQSWRESGFQRNDHTGKCKANGEILIGAENSSEHGIVNSQSCHSSPYYLSFAKAVPFTPTIATFNILMKACGTDYYRAQALMDEIKIAGLSPNHISWSIFINICGSTGNVGGSIQALKAMRDNGVKPDVIAYTTAIKACVRNKSIKLAFSLFEEMKRLRVKPNLVTYNTLLRARRRYGSLHEVQQCLAIYQDMRKAGYNPNDYFLKELVEEWCEEVITNNNRDKGIVGRADSHNKSDRGTPQSMLLERVAEHLQRDISQSLVVDLRGVTKVEARIVILAVLRMIKENYTLGDTLEDDIVVILGVSKELGDATNHKVEVQNAVVKLLQDELGLSVILEKPTSSVIIHNDVGNGVGVVEDLNYKKCLGRNEFPIDVESSARRPAVLLRRLKTPAMETLDVIDKSWIHFKFPNSHFIDGVKKFIEFAKRHHRNKEVIPCACARCRGGGIPLPHDTVVQHCYKYGFDTTYTCWFSHGEKVVENQNVERETTFPCMDDGMDMGAAALNTVVEGLSVDSLDTILESNPNQDNIIDDVDFTKNLREAMSELYPGCTSFTVLRFVVKMFDLKIKHGLTNQYFTELLQLLQMVFPAGNKVPDNTYQADKIICDLGLKYEKIHACRNDCILYWGNHKTKQKYPTCNASRYKIPSIEERKMKTRSPAKVLRYFPLTDRLKRLYSVDWVAKEMCWHSTGNSKPGKLGHPVDSAVWKQVDLIYPTFSAEPRNVRLGLATDGFNPFSNMSTSYSSWPVMLVVYNLPPWLCMKPQFTMLTTLIEGPRQPGKDIDIYFQPLIKELNDLWRGTRVKDAYQHKGSR